MGGGKISIQRQRMFTFGDALRSTLGPYVDNSQVQMRTGVVGDSRQGCGQLRFARREGRHGIGHKRICALDRIRPCRSDERVDIIGVGGECAVEKAARLRNITRV